jgi:hypothetical protein
MPLHLHSFFTSGEKLSTHLGPPPSQAQDIGYVVGVAMDLALRGRPACNGPLVCQPAPHCQIFGGHPTLPLLPPPQSRGFPMCVLFGRGETLAFFFGQSNKELESRYNNHILFIDVFFKPLIAFNEGRMSEHEEGEGWLQLQ